MKALPVLRRIFDKGLTIRAGQAPVANHIDNGMQPVATGKIRLDDVITHRLPLADSACLQNI